MNTRERFRRLKKKTGLSYHQFAEIFGVEYETVQRWHSGKKYGMSPDCTATLARLEGEQPELSPRVRPETARAFFAAIKIAEVTQ